MPVFSYKALDHRQATVSGTVAADSPRQARDLLRGRGLLVEDVRCRTVRSHSLGRLLLRKRGNGARLAALVRELSMLLSAGVDMVASLETLSRQHRGYFQMSILMLKDRVAAGAQLAEAMGDQSDVFDELTVRMVEAGERSGMLEDVLGQLADFQERSLQLKDRVIGVLLYPAVVFVIAMGVSVFLMTVVTPMLLSSLTEAGRTLPWPTRVLKAVSDLLLHHGFAAAVVVAVLVGTVIVALNTQAGRRVWHRWLLWIPVVGTLASRQSLARLAATLATLLRSGLDYLQASEIAAQVTGNLVFREALLESGREIQAGADIGMALERTGVFPPLVVHVFTVGQATGRLEDMLDRLAVDYNRQAETLSNRLASVLEPILILFLTVLVGFILFATMLPILEAGNVS